MAEVMLPLPAKNPSACFGWTDLFVPGATIRQTDAYI